MNYLEIFNKVLLELNFRPVNDFSAIYKNEHLRVLENIKRVNSEVCTSSDWDFLRQKSDLKIPENFTEVENPINGRIISIQDGGVKLKYSGDYENLTGGYYAVSGKKLILPKSGKERNLSIIYCSANTAVNANGVQKENFEEPTDVSIIPKPFCDDILVYGATTKTKANPAFVKFGFWNANYCRALGRLRAECCLSRENEPRINITHPRSR